jgi:predicted O-methyltransferase YrrM
MTSGDAGPGGRKQAMSEQLWAEVDSYMAGDLIGEDDVLSEAIRSSAAAGLPAISVSPLQGKFLQLMARLMRARRVLEIGTLGGFSAIWLARALPADGKLISLELSPEHAEVARANIARAGLGTVVEVMVGPALETLPHLAEEVGPASFDLTFIDADKPNNLSYFQWALKLTRPGGAIVVDNVVRQGQVVDDRGDDPNVEGARRLFEALKGNPAASATALQTVGSKGYDGFIVAIVEGGEGGS